MPRLVSGRLLILAGVLLVLQYGLTAFGALLNGRPDLLYLLVLDYGLFGTFQRVPFFALGVGLVRDFIGGHLFGIETVCLAVTGFLLYFAMLKLERESLVVRYGVTALFVLLTESLSLALGIFLGSGKSLNFSLIGSVVLTTIYTTALSPGFFWLTNRWFRRTPALKQYELF